MLLLFSQTCSTTFRIYSRSSSPLFPPLVRDKATATHDLLVEDLATATLEITVRDENRLGKDILIGNASLPLSLLPALHQSWTGWLPLTVEGKEGGRGQIELLVQVLPAVGEGEGIELSESAAVASAAAAATAVAAKEAEAEAAAVDSDDDNDDDEVGREGGRESRMDEDGCFDF